MRNRRHLARTLAFQTLFEMESRGVEDLEQALRYWAGALEEETGEILDEHSIDFARRLVGGTLQHRQEIDQRIARVAPTFPVEQLPVTDRVVLELAIYELTWDRDAPVRVIINEAVELAKTFGSENSGRFVNGVLGTIAEELESPGSRQRTTP